MTSPMIKYIPGKVVFSHLREQSTEFFKYHPSDKMLSK